MNEDNSRRRFLKDFTISGVGTAIAPSTLVANQVGDRSQSEDKNGKTPEKKLQKKYNSYYSGEQLNRIAFPIGGIGAGMFCLEGTGAISHLSIWSRPDFFNEPTMFAALSIPGKANAAKLIEGPVPEWKIQKHSFYGGGGAGMSYGLPRFNKAVFLARFPYAQIDFEDDDIPLKVSLNAWSPFIPGDADNSSLPFGCLEYSFHNPSKAKVEAVFSYHSRNFLSVAGSGKKSVRATKNGFILSQAATNDKPFLNGDFAICTDRQDAIVDHCWFRGGWWDPLTMVWNTIRDAQTKSNPPVDADAPGGSVYVPVILEPGASTTIKIMMTWFVPDTNLRVGDKSGETGSDCINAFEAGLEKKATEVSFYHKPWYSSRFKNIGELNEYVIKNLKDLDQRSALFRDALYASTIAPEVIEAIAANLTILKSTTVLRQYDGRLWNWEGCSPENGCCEGSCTHVWNYAQAVAHLFPALERSLRHTEFCENQNSEGHQGFRAGLPISPINHKFHSAADGQLGGIMKVYREWRISGDSEWLKKMYPLVKKSIDYCIRTWDPGNKGILEEPHHNTYDIEFWGPNGMCTTFYLGALQAMVQMSEATGNTVTLYQSLLTKGKQYLETELFDGEYFFQKIVYSGLRAPDPVKAQSFNTSYSDEAIEILKKEGPKYQYGKGCLSDGVLGSWIAGMCGLKDPVDAAKIKQHLVSVHRYNLRNDLSDHGNPQRPTYAMGHEAGLLLCTWPKGGKLSLPFVYSDEVWTGIEYQVAAHLMQHGEVSKALEIVRACRNRYDGRVRNPFNEFECGSWYGRALSSYGMLQALTGVRYDAVDRTLYVDSRVGDFTCFLAVATGFGTVTLQKGKISVKAYSGTMDFDRVVELSSNKL